MKTIINSIAVWGDSILKGVLWNSERNCYTLLKENAAKLMTQLLGISLLNRSTMGRTIVQGGIVLENDLEKGCVCDAALIEFGGNDCDFHWDEIARDPGGIHQPKTRLNVFEDQLRAMIKKVGDRGMQALLMTLPPLHAQRYFDFITRDGLGKNEILSWLGGDVQMIYRWHERYSNAIMRIAAETASQLIDVRDAFLNKGNYEDFLCDDGIHPNERGHRLIADVFVSFAEAL